MIIVDTTVWVDYLKGTSNPEAQWLDANVGRREIGLIDLILCEVLQGVRNDKDFLALKKQLFEFNVFASGGAQMAEAAAMNFRELRKRGITIRKTIDCWIGTFCLLKGHALLHRDKDFDGFENQLGLRVIKA
jgi:hypothetical protein